MKGQITSASNEAGIPQRCSEKQLTALPLAPLNSVQQKHFGHHNRELFP